MQQIQDLYTNFLKLFPQALHPIISILIVVVIVYALAQVIKKDFIYLIVLIVLLPASVPILKSVGQGIVDLLKFFLHTK